MHLQSNHFPNFTRLVKRRLGYLTILIKNVLLNPLSEVTTLKMRKFPNAHSKSEAAEKKLYNYSYEYEV